MPARTKATPTAVGPYAGLVGDIGKLLEAARRPSARSVNALMTATCWEIGRRIVEFEQGDTKRAGYGEELLKRLAIDSPGWFGRGFPEPNLERMRLLYEMFPPARIASTLSRQLPATCPTKCWSANT